MKPEQQRIAIAKACGWKWNAECNFAGRAFPECWTHDDYPMAFLPCDLPDYLNDLNAMHEAENMLTEDQAWEQVKLLTNWKPAPAGFPLIGRFQATALLHATAAQRSEAFLRTLNLWKS